MIQIAILGLGTVGTGVAKVVAENAKQIERKLGEPLQVKAILVRHFKDGPYRQLMTDDFRKIEEDESIRVVVETIGGVEVAYEYTKRALQAGKHVVTANKQLVAERGCELLELARKKNVSYLFEASVGGGIPIIRPLYRCLMGERIEEITGILNGTTNFILTKMDKEGESFENALKEAQNLGYAERNPEADVEGHDTCRKIAILTAMATGKEVNYEDIYTEGITRITDIDFKYAEKMGTSVKLFGTSRIKDGRVLAYVAPVMINKTSPLYSVNDVFNGILVKGNMLGTSMFYGSGAGKLPTGSAVVADIIEAAQNLKRNVPMGWTGEKQAIESMDQAQFRYFVRVAGSYRNKEQDVKNAFGQVEVIELYGMDEFAFLTAQMTEGEFKKGAVSYDARERERSEYGIKQMIRAVL